jgi:hypothetical protein
MIALMIRSFPPSYIKNFFSKVTFLLLDKGKKSFSDSIGAKRGNDAISTKKKLFQLKKMEEKKLSIIELLNCTGPYVVNLFTVVIYKCLL